MTDKKQKLWKWQRRVIENYICARLLEELTFSFKMTFICMVLICNILKWFKNKAINQGLYWEVPFVSPPHLHLSPFISSGEYFSAFLCVCKYKKMKKYAIITSILYLFIQKVLYYRCASFSYPFTDFFSLISWRSSHINIYRVRFFIVFLNRCIVLHCMGLP